MNRIARRSTICLILALILIGGMLYFVAEYVTNADDWALFQGNPHIYTGNNINCGIITDSDGVVILDATAGRVYSDDYATRLATLHWLGDRDGRVSAPAVYHYASEMAGHNQINGLYSYSGANGIAKMTFSTQIQKVALEAMGDKKGTIAVYNYKTGEIICAVTTPTYDPDNVPDIEGDTSGKYKGVYLNRFTQSSYTPGSIFKVITTAAALETDRSLKNKEFSCTSEYSFGADSVTCEKSHGKLNLTTALARSCNCYFAQLVEYLGGKTLQKYVDQFQVTKSITFDGFITKEGNFDIENAAAVQVAWSGIGQHLDLINPCRFMTVMGAIADGGEAAMPYIVSKVSNADRTVYSARRQSTGKLMSADTAQLLTEMMRNNVITIYGEGNFPGLKVCAKSGTAQVGEDMKPNATFAGFVSDEAYPFAFIVVVEDAGSGSEVCVPILSSVLSACKDWTDRN